MAASGSVGSWSLISRSTASSKSPSSVPSPEPSYFKLNSNTVKIFVGPKLHLFSINEDLFHKYIADFHDDFRQCDFFGQEKIISLPNGDPKDVEALVKWMEGRKDIFTDQYVYEGLGYKVHDMTCFKLFKLAAEMDIEELMEETLEKLGECLRGGKWPITEEAVTAACRSANPNMEALKSRLIYGAEEEFFTGGLVGEGSLWKKALRVDVTFEKDVAVAIGYHMTRDDGDCTLDKCYVHHVK